MLVGIVMIAMSCDGSFCWRGEECNLDGRLVNGVGIAVFVFVIAWGHFDRV